MGRKYDFELRYLKNQLAHEGQWWLVLLDFSCSFIWAQLVLSPEFPFKIHSAKAKSIYKITNNDLGPLINGPAETTFVPSEHYIFGKKCRLLRKI